MLAQKFAYSQAASITTPNVLAGAGIQIIGRASLVDLYGASFLAAATDTIAMNYTVGGDSKVMVPAGSPLNLNAAGPQNQNDEIFTDFAVPAGANLTLSVTSDATAGTHTGKFLLKVKP